MSTAAKFLFPGAFPFCPTLASGIPDFDYVGGLSLSTVMAFFWNIEDIQISTTGNSVSGMNAANADGTLQFNSPAITGSYVNNMNWEFSDSAMLVDSGGQIPFGSLPSATKTPRQRVCSNNNEVIVFASQDNGFADNHHIHQTDWDMRVHIDPNDSTKLAIYYRFVIRAGISNTYCVAFANPARGSQSSSGNFQNGTFSMGGLTFNWYVWFNVSMTGAFLGITTTNWTY